MGPPPRGRKPEGGTGPSAEDPQCTESSGVPERRGPTAISRGSRCPELATRRSVRSSTAAGPQVRELLVMIEGSLMGRVRADKAGGLSLDYEASWRESPQGHSLSVSMPLAQQLIKHVGERLATITPVTSSRSSARVKARRGDSSG